MSSRTSDLVRDSRLNTEFLDGQIKHIYFTSSRSARQRRVKVEEIWSRQKELGNGTYGQVWLESCISGQRSGKVRAVKAIRKDKTLSSNIDYKRELEATAKFSHDRVRYAYRSSASQLTPIQYVHCFVKSFGWYESEEAVFISMEYLEHGDLQKQLDQPLPEIEAKEIASQIVEGLGFMHENDFVHRDLKPAVWKSLQQKKQVFLLTTVD
jgi:serine/threonine protein kinase